MRRGSLLTSGWFITVVSLIAIAVLVLLLWDPFSGRSHAGKTIVFDCAAGMKKPVEKIIRQYEREYGVTVKATYGGSGAMREKVKLYGGDLYLAADSFHMDLAVEDGLVQETMPIANIRPVLIVHKAAQKSLQAAGNPITSLRDLLREDFKIVLANPETTAVGRMSQEMLDQAGIWGAVEKRRREGGAKVSWLTTVNQVAQDVSIRQNAVGIVFDAIAKQFPDLHAVALSEAEEQVETIRIAVVAKSKDPSAALHFARYLSSRDKGQPIFAEHHFEATPDADIWEHEPRLRIYAGTMLKDGLQPILEDFEKREGVKIGVTYNGCGVLVAGMETLRGRNDFPDAYVSCDITFADKVQEDFHAARTILQNDLVFLVQRGNPKKVSAELREVERTDIKMGMPHPKQSAMGKIFAELLESQHITPSSKLKYFTSGHHLISQMLVGALDLAVVGRSNARNSEESRENLEVIDIAGPLLVQTFQIARNSKHRQLMERLQDAIAAPESLQRFKDLGFKTDVGNAEKRP